MTNISRDSDVVELNGPPAFDYGDKVRSRRNVRNDGTFPGQGYRRASLQEGRGGLRRQHRDVPAAILHLWRRVHLDRATASA